MINFFSSSLNFVLSEFFIPEVYALIRNEKFSTLRYRRELNGIGKSHELKLQHFSR